MTTENDKQSSSKRRRRRAFGAVRQLPSGRWQARYRDKRDRLVAAPHTFPTKTDATRYLALVEADQLRGSFHDPKRGETPFGVWADQWLKGATLRPTTSDLYDYLLRRFIKPTFTDIALNDIDDALAVEWLDQLRALPSISEATVAKAYRLFARIMGAAVENRYILHTTWKVKGAGRERSPEMRFASPEQINALAAEVPPRYRALVLLAGYCGLRWGELVGLRRHRIDLEARTVAVVEQMTEIDGHLQPGSPKSEAGKRVVTMPRFVANALTEHLTTWAKEGAKGLVFPTPEGGLLRRSNFRRRVWLPAVEAVGVEGLRFHDLRHSAATLAAAAGATTKELMARIGHSSYEAAIRYQHVVAERDAAIADALEGLGNVRPLKAKPKRDRSGTDVARGKRKPPSRSSGKSTDQGGKVVELMGLEPTTPCLQSRCSSS
jgi:integrase